MKLSVVYLLDIFMKLNQLIYKKKTISPFDRSTRDETNLPHIPDGIDVSVGQDRSQVRIPIFGRLLLFDTFGKPDWIIEKCW